MGESRRTCSSTLPSAVSPSLLPRGRQENLTHEFKCCLFSANTRTSRAGVSLFASSFPSLVLFLIPWCLSIPRGSSCFPSPTTYSTFPLFGEHVGNCLYFPQNIWHRYHIRNMYNIWQGACLHASLHNACINFLHVNPLLQAPSAVKRLRAHGMQPSVPGPCTLGLSLVS